MASLYIWDNGVKWWYLAGNCHRANGPSVVWTDGTLYWYWNDNRVTEYEHMMLMGQEHLNG